MNSKSLILLSILLLLASSVRTADSDKVLIEMYTESLCPDCINFLTNSFSKAITTLNFTDIAELRLYPFGNAKESINPDNKTYSFKC